MRRIANNHLVALRAQRELVDIANTEVGEAINTELAEDTKRHDVVLGTVWGEMMRAIGEKHEKTGQVLKWETGKL